MTTNFHFLKVSVVENLGSEKNSFSVSENLVLEKNLDFGFREFGLEKKVSVSENLVSEKSLGFGFGEFGLGK